jgi:hypothetical protein
MRAATKRARVVRVMVTTLRVAHAKEGDGAGNKSDGNEGVVQRKGLMATEARAMATRVAGEQRQQRQRGWWRRQWGWWAKKRESARGARAMATAMRVDSDGDSGWNRLSGGSGGNNGYGGGRQQQKLRGQATINKMRQAAAVAAEIAAVAAVIVAAWLQRQAGAAVRRKWQQWEQRQQWQIPPFTLGYDERWRERR